jgi:hypothetical protein
MHTHNGSTAHFPRTRVAPTDGDGEHWPEERGRNAVPAHLRSRRQLPCRGELALAVCCARRPADVGSGCGGAEGVCGQNCPTPAAALAALRDGSQDLSRRNRERAISTDAIANLNNLNNILKTRRTQPRRQIQLSEAVRHRTVYVSLLCIAKHTPTLIPRRRLALESVPVRPPPTTSQEGQATWEPHSRSFTRCIGIGTGIETVTHSRRRMHTDPLRGTCEG